MTFENICFVASPYEDAQSALQTLQKRYGHSTPENADVIVALGGDGFMLQTLHENMDSKTPIYGLNFGSVGFLMNEFNDDDLLARLNKAEPATIHPLLMTARTADGKEESTLAINEVSLLRETRQTAKLKISVDGRMRMAELTCDGIIVSTPAGSTAYNLSAHGPIIPIDADLLAVTPISAFRPRRWRGALLPKSAQIRIEVLESKHRPVSAVADNHEIRDVVDVFIKENRSVNIEMLFDDGHSLEERILAEQFSY